MIETSYLRRVPSMQVRTDDDGLHRKLWDVVAEARLEFYGRLMTYDLIVEMNQWLADRLPVNQYRFDAELDQQGVWPPRIVGVKLRRSDRCHKSRRMPK